MKIVRNIFEFGDLWVISGETHTIRSMANKTPNIRQKYSELVFDGKYALKKIFTQKAADYFRRPFKSQGKREALSSTWMRQHGIKAPEIYAWGWAVFSPSGYDSFVLMEQILNYGSLNNILKKERDKNLRKALVEKIGNDLNIMKKYNKYHKDSHLNNLLICEGSVVVWIDNDLGRLKNSSQFSKKIKLLSSDLLSNDEKNLLIKYIQCLR